MIVYADMLFAINMLINYLLLDAAARFAGQACSRLRLLLSAALGGVYALLCALPTLFWLGGIAGKLSCGAIMLLLAFGFKRRTLRLGLWFSLLSAAWAGFVLLLCALFDPAILLLGGSIVYPIRFGALILLAGLCYGLSGFVLARFGSRSAVSDLKAATICILGRKLRTSALIDSGNRLLDPVTGDSVFILDARAAAKLLPELATLDLQHPAACFAQAAKLLPGARLIPYQAIGTSGGLLLAARSDWVLLGSTRLRGVMIALSPTPVSGGYELIAGGDNT